MADFKWIRFVTWEYADSTARGAAGGFSSTDLGKIAVQLDNTSYWILSAITPTWILVTGYISGGDAPANQLTLDDVSSSLDEVTLRNLNLKAHSVLAKQTFWQTYFSALTIEYQDLLHHSLFFTECNL